MELETKTISIIKIKIGDYDKIDGFCLNSLNYNIAEINNDTPNKLLIVGEDKKELCTIERYCSAVVSHYFNPSTIRSKLFFEYNDIDGEINDYINNSERPCCIVIKCLKPDSNYEEFFNSSPQGWGPRDILFGSDLLRITENNSLVEKRELTDDDLLKYLKSTVKHPQYKI